jgi:hypothetical protein
MDDTITELMHANLLEVFNERDGAAGVPRSSTSMPMTSDGPTTIA